MVRIAWNQNHINTHLSQLLSHFTFLTTPKFFYLSNWWTTIVKEQKNQQHLGGTIGKSFKGKYSFPPIDIGLILYQQIIPYSKLYKKYETNSVNYVIFFIDRWSLGSVGIISKIFDILCSIECIMMFNFSPFPSIQSTCGNRDLIYSVWLCLLHI